MKKLLAIFSLVSLIWVLLPVSFARAQSTSYWSSCSDGETIVRCETYNCVNGDTNNDGRCTVADKGAELTESRNDSFCANPASGCGEVLYFASNKNNSCAVRVKENNNNCNLYTASTPNFGGATIVLPTPTPTPVSRLNTSPVPSSKPVLVKTLPKTGPALWLSMIVAAVGVYGFHHYGKDSKENND